MHVTPTRLLTAALLGIGLLAAPAAGAAVPDRAVAQASTHARVGAPVQIRVLSSRADLVSGGDALISVDLPSSSLARKAQVTLDDKAVTGQLEVRGASLVGLVRGLKNGDNDLEALLPDGRGAMITLTNHPSSGPLISGPQLTPWKCQRTATNKKTCAQAPKFSTFYWPKGGDAWMPYVPSIKAIAKVKTDNGTTVPLIIRVETGYMDRDQYQVATLFQPGKKWTALSPQRQFDHKMLITHGFSCAVDHQTGTAPDTYLKDATAMAALKRGYVVMSTALDHSGHNCNVALQAESLLMAKEHVAERYGTVDFTIGSGCSGGSLAQQWIANAYPGVYQGILPTCSFPDALSTATQFLDYHLLLDYFVHSHGWTAAQKNAVMGGPDGLANANVSDHAQFHVAVPTDPCAGTTDQQRYDAETNPGGVRCTVADAAANLLGLDPENLWDSHETAAGTGFVRLPIDNIGVQYGLKSLLDSTITPQQFVDLNAGIGGVDLDANLAPERTDATGFPQLANAYRSGMINEANNLGQTAIIDCRGPNPGLFHDAYRAFAIRARLDAAQGNHDNDVIWEGPVNLTADSSCGTDSFAAMDHWLTRVSKDTSDLSLAEKVVADKPAEAVDSCYDGSGNRAVGFCADGLVNIEDTPRMVAGDDITTDTNKCQLTPLDRGSYGSITFTDDQWATLQSAFPDGVCDFDQPGVDQQGTVPWLTYQQADGSVVYGGTPLGDVPVSTPIG